MDKHIDNICDMILDAAEDGDLYQGDRFLDLVDSMVHDEYVMDVLRAFLGTGMDNVVETAMDLWGQEMVCDGDLDDGEVSGYVPIAQTGLLDEFAKLAKLVK